MFRNPYIPALAWALVILVLTLTPGNYIPQPPWDIFQFDKLVHCFIFFIQALLALRGAYIKEHLKNTRIYLSIFIICTLFGICIELVQHFVPGRSMSPADAIANTTGTLLGLWLGRYIRFRF